ncbi:MULTISPECIES: histidine-type phosphatase [unclassified Asaia]|uniref:histidine-type phosphatase n=1 Tax=unclassified Asaia TaxID=2685023 RepID=UPI000F8EC5D7|nr:histidine-type phosphatase [Asaia sp. W19]
MRRALLLSSLIVLGSSLAPCEASPAGLSVSASSPGAQDRLDRVVLVARHGIRSPTQDPATLARETGVIWPEWPVVAGQLTDHGRATLRVMMEDIARFYDLACKTIRHSAQQRPCLSRPAPVIWADSADERTMQSGEIMAAAFTRNDAIGAQGLFLGKRDPLFEGASPGFITQNYGAIHQDVEGAREEDRDHRSAAVSEGLASLQAFLAPRGCADNTEPCFAEALTTGQKKGRPVLEGGGVLAASLAENLLLIYVEGLDRSHREQTSPDWVKRIDPRLLSRVLPVHEAMARLTRRRGVLVQEKAHLLAEVIERFLSGEAVRLSDTMPLGRTTRFLAFAGHDTTLDALAARYGLDWHFSDQPDGTAPDTTMAFERWLSPSGVVSYRVRLFHQSLAALREGRGLDLRHGGAVLLAPGRL